MVVFEDTADHFRGILGAPSLVETDALALAAPIRVPLLTVPRESSVVLGDSDVPVEIFHVPTSHGDDMVLPVATHSDTGTKVAFVADIWNPNPFGFSFPEWALPLDDHIARYGINTDALLFAGGHGGVGDFAEFAGFVGFLRSLE